MNTIVILGRETTPRLLQTIAELGYRAEFHRSFERARPHLESDQLVAAIFDDDGEQDLDISLVPLARLMSAMGRRFIVVSDSPDKKRIEQAVGLGAADYALKPLHPRELIFRLNAVIHRKPRIVCIGGGTGLFTLLSGLRQLSNALLTAVVSMADDGGSSGRLRASFGILPPGDVRKCLVALSNAPDLMNHVMRYRFGRGDSLSGHNIGNLILTALAEMTGTMSGAVKALGDILSIQGVVMCATNQKTTLCAEFENGAIVRGERLIDKSEGRPMLSKMVRLWHEPIAGCDADAYASILVADLVVVGPGDLYTSVIANLVLGGIPEAVARSRGQKVYICNLMTKPGETAGYSAGDHIREMVRYLKTDCLDYVLLSDTEFSDEGLGHYAKLGQEPVRAESDEELRTITSARIARADIGHESEIVRHDPNKLLREVRRILDHQALELRIPVAS